MNHIRLVIPGEPVAKARPKLATVHGHAMAFTPQKTRRYEDIVRNVVSHQWAGRSILQDVAITMRVTVFRGIPKSWSKRKQSDALTGAVRPLGKPDWDNFGKAISDGLNGLVYLDDALIVDAHVQKFYSLEPRVEVALSW
jgi:Holliday junction resolvase RusA-like endonuclease